MVDLKQANRDVANFCFAMKKEMRTYKVFCAGGYNSQNINEQLYNYILNKSEELIKQIRISVIKFCRSYPSKADQTFKNFVDKGFNSQNITEKVFNATLQKFYAISSNTSSPTNPPASKPVDTSNNVVQTKSSLKIIDGFMVDTKSGFIPTINYVSKRYKEFNKKYFEDQLPNVPIKIADTKGSAGMVRFAYRGGVRTIVDFRISQKYGYPEEVVCNTILHEMIHVYQHAILHEAHRNRDAHGISFIREMRRINAFGWKISTQVTEEEHSTAILTDLQKSKLHNFKFYAFYKSNNLCMGKIRISNSHRLRSPDLAWFAPKKPKSSVFVSMPETKGLSYSYSGHPLTIDEVKKLLADEEISLISAPDKIKEKLGLINKVRESIDKEDENVLYVDGDYRIVIENGERIEELS